MKNKNIIILDLDGVLITTPHWRRDILHEDGYSTFNDKAVQFLNNFLSGLDAELWLISDRRKGYTLEQFNVFFKNRKIEKQLSGMVPVYDKHLKRIEEFEKFIQEEIHNYLLIDDDSSLEDLKEKHFWIKTSPLIGFNEEKLQEAKEKIKNWKL